MYFNLNMFVIFNKYLTLNKPFVTILYFYQLLINDKDSKTNCKILIFHLSKRV